MNCDAFTMDCIVFASRAGAGQTVCDSTATGSVDGYRAFSIMTFARILYVIARFALFLAVFAIAAGTGIRVLHIPSGNGKSLTVDSRVDFPSNWATYPEVAKLQTEDLKVVERSDAMFTGTDTSQGPLGDVLVRFKETFCTAGGSSCTGSTRDFFDLRVGDLDMNGAPAIATEVACTTTSTINRGDPLDSGKARRCAPTSLTLRRSPDGNIFVVTFAKAQSYREAPALDRAAIFFGTKSEALTRAQTNALLGSILCFASAGIAALAAAFILF